MSVIESIRGVLWARRHQPDQMAVVMGASHERFGPQELLRQARCSTPSSVGWTASTGSPACAAFAAASKSKPAAAKKKAAPRKRAAASSRK